MRVKLLVGTICIFFVGLQPIVSQSRTPAPESCALIRQALDDSLHIKAGMTRDEVEKNFTPDGGLQPSKLPSTTRYLYVKCSFIKIDVKFKAAAANETGSLSPDDIVVSASKPYLQYPFAD
jgi:hypothetical protein